MEPKNTTLDQEIDHPESALTLDFIERLYFFFQTPALFGLSGIISQDLQL